MINEKLAVWVLSCIDGLGPASMRRLIEIFGSAADVFECPIDKLAAVEGVRKLLVEKITADRDWDLTAKQFDDTIPAGAKVVVLTDPEYPAKLRNIPDPPALFYYKGKLDSFENPSLAVVGSRTASDYGLRITSRIVRDLASAGVMIVSGLAHGIDSAAHEATLDVGGRTTAVFGNGLDIFYPAGNRKLAGRIIEAGCLISEFPRATKPIPYNFPVRNRIISGLSDGVLVVEALEKSGALVTAKLGLDQGRDILAIPGSVDSRLSAGSNELIKQGAVPVTSAEDIFNNFGWHPAKGKQRSAIDPDKLNSDEKLIYNHLSVQPVHLDELGRKVGLGPGKTAEVLLKLELKGFIIRKPGNYVVIA